MKKLLTFLMLSVLAIGVGWATDGDLHDMGKSQSTLLNNNAAIPSINIDEQSYPIKAVTINWRYNKATEDVVTIEVKVGGTSWGTQNVGTNTTADAVFEGESTIGAVEIIFTNNAGDGTGKGTFYVNSVKLTEGASSGGPFSLTLPIGLTGGSVTASGSDDLTAITAGTEMTVTANPSTGYVLDWMKANGTAVENPYTFNIYADTEITAAFKEKPTYLFYESFNSCNKDGGNDDIWSNISTSGTIETDNVGWGFLKGNAANACARFGTSSSLGSATSPTINVAIDEIYVLTFKAGAWNGNNEKTTLNVYGQVDNQQVNILYSDPNCSVPLSSVIMTKGAWTDYIVYVKSSSSKIKIVWEGQDASNSRFFLDEVLLEETVVPEIATPVIAGETPFLTSTEVTITCATEGATIYYTTDGTDPTNESTEYVAPFEINDSKTVKAIAYDANNNASSVASKEFVKTPSVTTVQDILALTDGVSFVFNGTLVVSGQNGEYLYAQDATGGILLYGTAPNYTKGQVIPAGFSAKYVKNYKGAPELKEMDNMDGATETAQLTAEEITPSQVTVANVFKYAVIKGATINDNTITVGEETVALYNRFGVTVPTDGKTYDIYGITGWYNGAQFMPLEFVAEAEPEYYLVGSFNTYVDENNETQWVQQDVDYKFTLTDDGKYVLDGVVCPDNVEFKILKVKGSQIIWCGGPADGEVYGIHGGWYKDIPLTIDGGKNYKIDAAGTFNFTMTIDKNNSNNNKFTVIKTPVVVKGSFDGWSENGEEMSITETNNGWTKTKQLNANTEFGFRDGWGNWHGGNGKEIAKTDLGENLTMGSDGNFKILVAGEYSLSVNRDLTTLVVNQILTPHNIVVESGIEGGAIAIKDDKTTAVEGETVTILVTPNENYVLENLVVTNSNTQQAIEVTEDYTFVMPDADVTVTASFKVNPIVEVMFDYRKDAEFAQDNGTEMEISEKEGISITFDAAGNTQNSPKWYTTSNGNARVYVDNTITIDGGANYIEKVEFNFEGNYSLSTPTTSVGNYSDGTWTLGSDKGVLTADKTARIAYIIVYVDKEKKVVQSPVITGETPFLENTTVTITCETEGAEIHYTLNGQDPTAESTLYTEPFTINEAVTVKAIAFKNGNSSSIASKAFEQIPIVATIADYLALDDNTTFVFTGDAVVTYQNGSNTWIKDETGYALIYASGQPEYSNGDVIPAGWGGKKMTYNNVPEITNPTGLESATETSEAIPVVKTVADITNDDVNAYYKINDIILSANTDNFNIVDGETELAGYNKFSITMPEDVEGKSFNVVGVITIYNNKPEFYIISCEEILQPVVLEGVAFTADRKWATWYGEEALALPENVTAYVVTGINTAGTAVEVESVNYIPANVGVLLYSNTAMESVSAMPAEAGESVTSLLQGGPATISDAYVLYDNQFILAQDGTTVGAHRCYLPMTSEAQGAPRLLIGDPGTVTGIEDLRYDNNGKPVGYYDLTGRYVGTSLNGKRGIFITSDGKKVVR